MPRTVDTLAESAKRIMAEHPSELGWHRVASSSCGGTHAAADRIPGAGDLVLWRRLPNYYDPNTFRLLDAAEDPPLWVAEQITTALCCGTRFVHIHRELVPASDALRRELGQPWTITPGSPKPGATVTLTAENGRWVWELTGERSPGCGGYLARWAD